MEDETRNLLMLIKRSEKNADADGWVPVSDQLWPYIQKAPAELVDFRHDQHCRLNDKGQTVLAWS